MKKIICTLPVMISLFIAGTTAFSQKQPTSASMFTSTSNEAKSFFNQGLKMSDENDAKKARNYFQKAVEQDPKLAIGYLYLASHALTPQDFAGNLKKAKENLSPANQWETLHYTYLETFLTNDPVKRLATAQTLAAQFPEAARAQVLLGDAYAGLNDITNARKHFQNAISIEPSWTGGYTSLAESYLFNQPKDFKKAETNVTKLLTLSPTASGYILLGDVYRAQNNLIKARDTYGKAVKTDAESAVALYKRGHALTYLGQFENARADYEKAGSIDEVNTFAVRNIAHTYLYQNEPAKALQYLLDEAEKTSSITDASKATTAKYNLLNGAADIAFHINDVQAMEKILAALKPISEEVGKALDSKEGELLQKSSLLNNKALLYLMKEDYGKAIEKAEAIKTVLEPIKNPRKLEGYESLLGHINYRQMKFDEAVTHFEAGDKNDVYNKYWLGRAYESASAKDKATAIYKELATYNFNNTGYALIRNEVKKKM